MGLASIVVLSSHVPAQNPAPPGVFNPSWLSEGKVLYESNEGGRYALWIVGADGSGSRRFLPVDFEHGQSVVSPDGKRVAFVFNTGSTSNDIFVVNADGTGRVNVTNAPGSQYLPRWSPDSRRILYVSDVAGTRERDLFIVDVESRRATNLTNTPSVGESNAAWAPGPRIVFTVRQGSESNVHTINADGSERRQISQGLQAGSPSWSPDGLLTFTSRHEGPGAIYTMSADGQNLRRIANDSLAMSNPVWSPDGKQLAFIISAQGRSRLFVSSATGTNRVCVAGTCQ
jgi:TolB protein